MSFQNRRVCTWKGVGEGMDWVIQTGTCNGISWGSNDGLVDLVEKYGLSFKKCYFSRHKMFT